MDYKYIEQLLERYFDAATTPQEEDILRAFFMQDVVPTHLMPYKELFAFEDTVRKESLSDDFDARLLARIEKKEPLHVRAVRQNRFISLRPLYTAAASIAIIALVGLAARHSITLKEDAWDYNPDHFTDTYNNEQQAYTTVEHSLQLFRQVATQDTMKQEKIEEDRE